MKRISIGILAVASLAVGAAGCSQNAFESVAVTKSPAAVASCEKVGDITASAGTFDETDATTQLTRAARNKGANTILVATDDADKGTAYRCSMPSLASTSKASDTGSK